MQNTSIVMSLIMSPPHGMGDPNDYLECVVEVNRPDIRGAVSVVFHHIKDPYGPTPRFITTERYGEHCYDTILPDGGKSVRQLLVNMGFVATTVSEEQELNLVIDPDIGGRCEANVDLLSGLGLIRARAVCESLGDKSTIEVLELGTRRNGDMVTFEPLTPALLETVSSFTKSTLLAS